MREFGLKTRPKVYEMLCIIFQLHEDFDLMCLCNDINKEKDFVYLVTVVRATLPMMFGWL